MAGSKKIAGKSALLEKQAFIFGSLFLLANQLQVIGDRYLEGDDLTTKQWFLIAAVMRFADAPPTLSEVSELIGSSRQNVKQLAVKLEKRGFIKIEKDEKDTRALRLLLTEQCRAYWKNREEQDERFITGLFRGLTGKETGVMADCFEKLLKNISQGTLPRQPDSRNHGKP